MTMIKIKIIKIITVKTINNNIVLYLGMLISAITIGESLGLSSLRDVM